MIERIDKKSFALALVVGLGASACAGYNPDDNEFTVSGVVADVGKQSLKIEITDIQILEGNSGDMLALGDTEQIHDNCDCHGFLETNKKYGKIIDYYGVEMAIDRVDPGSCVQVIGKIRQYTETDDDFDSNSTETKKRAVYDTAQIIDC